MNWIPADLPRPALPTRSAVRQRASRAPIILYVAIKPRLSPPAPIPAPVIIRPRPRTQKTEKHVPRRTNHNPRMSPPHHQIPSLRLRHSLKSFHSVIKIVRTRIGIRKPRPLVNRMHQMRAIALRVARRFRIERGSNHRQPVVRTHRPCALSPTFRAGCPIRSRFRRSVPRTCQCISRPNSLLRPRHTQRQPTEQNYERRFSPIPHDSILMPVPPPALVTIVQRPRCKSPRSPHVGTTAPGCPAAKRRKSLPRRILVSWDLSSQRVTASSPHGGTRARS
jgi:hypothetical protein